MTRVVIADDHSFFRSGLEKVLSDEGYQIVASVPDGQSALTAIAEQQPDIVILDVRMPELDGIATLQALRRRGHHQPVVLLAAEFEDAALRSAFEAGANALVHKAGAEYKLFDALSAVKNGGQYFDSGLIERFLAFASAKVQAVEDGALSSRERLIADAVANGLKNREIAETNDMSEAMVKLYLHRIYARLGINGRTELALYVRENYSRS